VAVPQVLNEESTKETPALEEDQVAVVSVNIGTELITFRDEFPGITKLWAAEPTPVTLKTAPLRTEVIVFPDESVARTQTVGEGGHLATTVTGDEAARPQRVSAKRVNL
jgi:hypothetical protein